MAGVRGVLVLLVLLLLASCTAGGDPPGSADPSVAPASPSPSRPREVRLDGVDPCTLLTEEQRAELGLDGKPRRDSGPLPPYPGTEIPLCTFGGFRPRAISIGVAAVSTAGIDLFRSGGLVVDLRATDAHGFPAFVVAPADDADFCTVVVDVAQGQTLDVNFRADGLDRAVSGDDLCRDAGQAADAAMATLLARH